MKKQLLLTAFLLLTGLTVTFGQAVQGSAPRPLTCTTGPWSPIAGVPYDYSADVSPLNGNAFWYATTSTTFVTAGARTATVETAGGAVVAAATNYATPAAVNSNPTTTNITWTSGGLAAATVLSTEAPKLFVVVEYSGAACAGNMKVYPIRPINAFTVDIRNIEDASKTPLAYDATEDQCVDKIQSATWVAAPAPNGSIDYDFGHDTLYYEVIAANFTGSFTPSFRLSGLIGDQTADIAYGTSIGTYGTSVTTGTGNGDYTGSVVTTSLTNTSNGVSIYVRVIIHNNDTELTVSNTVTLAVDAVNASGQPDVLHTDCTENAVYADAASQTVNPRPAITPVAPGTFLPVAP